MKWDDELEALVDKVRETFGDLAVSEAYLRAVTSAPLSLSGSSAVGDLLDDLPDDLVANTKVVDGDASAALLKDDLRRMLTPQ